MENLSAVRDQLLHDGLTLSQRRFVLDQAQALIDTVYVHRPHKIAMYGVDVAQQLRLLDRRLPSLDGRTFHYELLRILDGLRDMHTTYVLPKAYHRVALLGFVLERFWQGGTPHYLVSSVSDDPELVQAKHLDRAEIGYWNGMPIATAVERNAELEAGGNPAARTACGLSTMTHRSLAQSPLPAEDWVVLEGGSLGAPVRLDWKVCDEQTARALCAVEREHASGRRLGYSERTETNRQTRVQFFSRQRAVVQGPALEPVTTDEVDFKGEVKAYIVRDGGPEYGYLRIYTFYTALPSAADYLRGLRDLLGRMPENGLIIDVRGNGGGDIYAAEALLKYLTDRWVEPERMQFISSEETLRLCHQDVDLAPWRQSLNESGMTGEQFSAALPLNRPDEINEAKRVYPGRSVLITDALSYSATDMFAAGFQDNRIGPVLGVDDNTGAGGANRWTLDDLEEFWPAGPFRALPEDARLVVALRRSLRVGRQSGRPVEDLGVVPDVRYQLTREDLLCKNRDLIRRAIKVLADG